MKTIFKNTFIFLFLLNLGTVSSQTWVKLPFSYPPVGGTARIFSSKNNILIAGYNFKHSKVSYSADAGENWQQIYSDKSIVAAKFGPDNTMYLITSKKYLTTQIYYPDTMFKSSNGTSWTAISKLNDNGTQHDEGDYTISANNTLLFPNNFSGTGKTYLSKSTSNGTTWSNLGFDGDLYSVGCSNNADSIVLATYNAGLRYSHDGGVTFSNTSTAGSAGTILFAKNGVVFSTTLGQVQKSTDGGKTFTGLTPDPWFAMNISEFFMGANGKFYFWGLYGVYESDDCIKWTKISDNLPDNDKIKDMDMSDNFVYVVADTNLYKYSIGTPASVNKTTPGSSLKLFPNPTNGDFDIISDNNINLITISNLLGQTIQNIETNNLFSGKINIQNPFSKSGVYLISVKNERDEIFNTKIIVE